MKPENWDNLSYKEKLKIATDLFVSPRASYLISQALTIAIEQMKKVKKPYKEQSNIEDMEMLLEVLFPIYPAIKRSEKLIRKVKP